MADSTLVLLRHGESEWNALNLFTGWVDVDLTDKGRAEAIRDEMRQYDAPRLAAATIEGLIAGSDALPA